MWQLREGSVSSDRGRVNVEQYRTLRPGRVAFNGGRKRVREGGSTVTTRRVGAALAGYGADSTVRKTPCDSKVHGKIVNYFVNSHQ